MKQRKLVCLALEAMALLSSIAPTPVIAQQPQTQVAPISGINARYVNGTAPGYWPVPGSGLSLNLSSGTAVCSGAVSQYAGGSIPLPANSTAYVYVDATACTPAVNTSGFSGSTLPIAEVVTNGAAVVSVTDLRTSFTTSGASVSGTASVIPLYDPAHGGVGLTGSDLSYKEFTGTEVNDQPEALFSLHPSSDRVFSTWELDGPQYTWLQLDSDMAPLGKATERQILLPDGSYLFQAMSGTTANPSGYGNSTWMGFTNTSTETAFGGHVNFPVPVYTDAGLWTPYIESDLSSGSQHIWDANINDYNMGYNHGAADTNSPSAAALFIGSASSENTFHSILSLQEYDRFQSGDNQMLDIARTIRGGCNSPSDECDHFLRLEEQTTPPYQGTFQSASTDTTGHVVYALAPVYNNNNLGPENPLLDLSQGTSDTITSAGRQLTSAGSIGVITTGSHGVSSRGLLTSDASAGAVPINTPASATIAFSFAGSCPANVTAVISPNSFVTQGHSHPAEPIYLGSPTAVSGGCSYAGVELLHNHYTGDVIAFGSNVGKWLAYNDKTFTQDNATWIYVELITEDPTSTTETIAFNSFGGSDSKAHVTAITRYPGTSVINTQAALGGVAATMAHSAFVPNAGDTLYQPNTLFQIHSVFADNLEMDDPYEQFYYAGINLQDSVFDTNNSEIFNVNPVGIPFLTEQTQPGAIAVLPSAPLPLGTNGGECTGAITLFCVNGVQPGHMDALYGTFYGSQYNNDLGPQFQLGVDNENADPTFYMGTTIGTQDHTKMPFQWFYDGNYEIRNGSLILPDSAGHHWAVQVTTAGNGFTYKQID